MESEARSLFFFFFFLKSSRTTTGPYGPHHCSRGGISESHSLNSVLLDVNLPRDENSGARSRYAIGGSGLGGAATTSLQKKGRKKGGGLWINHCPHLQRDQSRALSVLSNRASSQPIHSVEPYIADKYDYAVGLRGPTNPSHNVTIASFVFLILCTRQLYRVIQQSMGP
jgi:hypothetical protein